MPTSHFTVDSINPSIVKAQYAIREELAIKVEAFQERLEEKDSNLVISSDIGNSQQKGLDQPPITFTRQIAALMEWPVLENLAPNVFPKDVVARAKVLSAEIGSIGAYSHSQGVLFIRKNVAKFIEERDGYPSDPEHIFLIGGASTGISLIIHMLITPLTSGVLILVPQHPLYTAILARHSGVALPYHLDEASGWSTSMKSIEAAITKAHEEGISPKALVIINPGNPTGAVLIEATQVELVRLCEKYSLVLLADEVYQANLQPQSRTFTSFKKIVVQQRSSVPLISFHSISKGVSGECGRRGGYFECTNISEDILTLIYKLLSMGLSSSLAGQIGVDSMVRPPKPDDESYGLWKQETDAIHDILRSRTAAMLARLNALPGVTCVSFPGAIYLYPQIKLSKAALDAARVAGKEPDAFYALELDETGICVVPSDGFGQNEEWHYRLTYLCPGVDEYVEKLKTFHLGLLKRYGA